MPLKIEKGIPMPHRKDRLNGVVGELKKMKAEESVLLPCCLATAYIKGKEAFGIGNFVARTEGSGVRVWRTK